MEYLFPVLLTFIAISLTIVVLKKAEKKILKSNEYRQSDIHKKLKPFLFAETINSNKQTQMDKMLEKNSVSVMIMDNKAYWVFQNVFYTADFVDGNVDPETTKPIDTSSMSRSDMEKMLFILDNLGDGNKNDSSGTR